MISCLTKVGRCYEKVVHSQIKTFFAKVYFEVFYAMRKTFLDKIYSFV